MEKNALKAGANVASELVETDDFTLNNIKNVGKKRIKEQAHELTSNLSKHVNDLIQKGSGVISRNKRKVYKRKVTRRNQTKNKLRKKLRQKTTIPHFLQ